MSSSRRARRRRRHEKYGKPSYPVRANNGLTANRIIVDEVSEWVNPYYSEGPPFVHQYTAHELPASESWMSITKKEERVRKFRSKFFFIDHR